MYNNVRRLYSEYLNYIIFKHDILRTYKKCSKRADAGKRKSKEFSRSIIIYTYKNGAYTHAHILCTHFITIVAYIYVCYVHTATVYCVHEYKYTNVYISVRRREETGEGDRRGDDTVSL